jgi:hypothetical protein
MCLHLQDRSSHRFSTLKNKAAGSSETLVPAYQTARRRITEDRNINIHRRANLRSDFVFLEVPKHVVLLCWLFLL